MKVALGSGLPVTLASGEMEPGNITVDATNVYWTSADCRWLVVEETTLPPSTPNGAVMTVPITGGMPTVLASGQSATGLALDGANIYWTNSWAWGGGTVTKMPLAGSTPTALVSLPATSQFSTWDRFGNIRVDATSIYWVDYSLVDNGSGGTISGALMKMPIAGGTPITITAATPPLPGLVRSFAAVDATSIYWMDLVDDDGGTESFAVMKIPRDGGTPTVLASGPGAGGSLAVDTSNVYWTTGFDTTAGGTVMKVALSGGASTVVASHQACRPTRRSAEPAT